MARAALVRSASLRRSWRQGQQICRTLLGERPFDGKWWQTAFDTPAFCGHFASRWRTARLRRRADPGRHRWMRPATKPSPRAYDSRYELYRLDGIASVITFDRLRAHAAYRATWSDPGVLNDCDQLFARSLPRSTFRNRCTCSRGPAPRAAAGAASVCERRGGGGDAGDRPAAGRQRWRRS